ncbi:hypothetical protein SO802_026889 [Lithocarpus litseifolius]|uniref:Zeta toxin domain-containing protein n=1 Tax=Lithocarpus litseifolius TaxID=425828 RepID=A0AAW2C434_9ROSI
MKQGDAYGKFIITHILFASFLGFVAAAATCYYQQRKSKAVTVTATAVRDQTNIPRLERTGSGRVGKLERFSHYVARQMGFSDANECPQLCKLAYDYLRKSEDCENSIYDYLSNEPEAKSLYGKLIGEFETCILSYFAFHWGHASLMISQVLNEESADCEQKAKLKDLVLAATRKQRFERVTKNLKVARVFTTLVEEIKAINGSAPKGDDSVITEVMAPMAHSKRSPVLLLMGGGMGAGKSTVLKEILEEPFWSEAKANAVLVEADAFKESDVIYRALSRSRGDGTITENYWEMVKEGEEEEQPKENGEAPKRKPYRIELVGMICDPYIAVVRGIRRAIIMGRAVRVNSQLNSHKRFASAFLRYCQLVDNARLFCTNAMGGAPELIARKDGDNKLLIDPEKINCLTAVSNLNAEAQSIYELYTDSSQISEPGSIWKDIVLSPSRASLQQELRASIQRIENPEPEIKDKALLSLINSTLTSQVFSLVVGITSSREVWNTLEQRFTSTLRANIVNLKRELQSIKKGNESVNSFLLKIKVARDKLLAIGVIVDNEKLICIVLRGLPREFAHFCSAIRTGSDPIIYEQLAIMLQSEEQAMTDHLDLVSHTIAMFASNEKANGSISNQSQNHGSGRGRGRGRGRNNANRGRGGGRMNFAYQGKNPPTKLAAMASASNAAITNNQNPWLVDLEFQAWEIKDKALLSLINSTLTSQVFSLVVGITSSREVWNTLEQRFTSTLRANIVNLKRELQSIKKGNESVNSFLLKIKVTHDKLLAIGVIVDNEELICIVLRGLSREFAHFCSAVRTRSDPIIYEQLAIMLQSEEQAMTDHLDLVSHTIAMFASNGKANGSSSISNQSQNHGSVRGRGRNNANGGRGGGKFNHGGSQ